MSKFTTETSEPDDQHIGLRSLQQLSGKRFWIPAYQRGYRWEPKQVEALLDDVLEFQPENKDSFYCLQPLVVKCCKDEWEVVDGQQRLTTLVLILRCLGGVPRISITYETRKASEKFIELPNNDEAKKNIDFHFIYQAHEAIKRWLNKERERPFDREMFKARLLDQVRVIWYPAEPTDYESSVTLFTRLNVGRIPLTDVELIRALFLRSHRQGRHEIALEWDQMEKALRSDALWLFLNPKEANPENRINLIFELVTPESEAAKNQGVFLQFYNRLNSATPDQLDAIWMEVRQVFHQLEAWYQDRTLFHLIGYLIATKDSIQSIRDLRCLEKVAETKSAFVMQLKTRIRERLLQKADVESFIGNLSYGKGPVKETLLLFNVASILQTKELNHRFDFAAFKSETWDIEHVHSQTPDEPGDDNERRSWLISAKKYLPDSHELTKEILELLGDWKEDKFKLLHTKLLQEYEDDDGSEALSDSIGNLALLDSETNRSYGNAMFPVKRGRILNLEKEGKFVPPATRNVFLKAFSSAVDGPLKWSSTNRDDYRDEISRTLKSFFSNQNRAAL